ncbi:HECT-domain-containing protein [Calocera viscosa TUFC12733]|uniref:HECT-type E3 ubiquitin transferase n=1 Tax=Calocera viscosa (strain TUFC12733) TaxID=1330018 RepID=A0A167N010_CALVF|nr:HECT-domain-containing protein [Calocera viscosa TUFC12733]
MAYSFEGPNRRHIDLAGSSRSSTSTAVLGSAREARLAREEQRRRERAATNVQKVWRGRREARAWRDYCADVWKATGSVPYLVGSLGPGDEKRLVQWCAQFKQSGLDVMNGVPLDRVPHYLRAISSRILTVACAEPLSPSASTLLSALVTLTAVSKTASHSTDLARTILGHLLERDLYKQLSSAYQIIPIASKAEPALPYLTTLATASFTVFAPTDPAYRFALLSITSYILSLPLLLNRLPIPALTHLSSHLPLQALLTTHVHPSFPDPVVARDVLANMIALVSPRLASWSGPAVTGWLIWGTALMREVGPAGFQPLSSANAVLAATALDDDDDTVLTTQSAARARRGALPPPDSRTLTRLSTLTSSSHLLSLISKTPMSSLTVLYGYLLTLVDVWVERRDTILPFIARAGRGGFEREIYRVGIRGKWSAFINGAVSLRSETLTSVWPALLLLTEIYSHALLTMGDDEFFSAPNAPKNPFSLDELTELSGLLLKVSFTLYWDGGEDLSGTVPGLSVTWEGVRERTTQLLVQIRARDSRRPFTAPEHWHMLPPSDLSSFVEAAVFEESKSDVRTKSLSKGQMARLSPRLGVLNNLPFAIPFEVRVGIFRQFVRNDIQSQGLYDGFMRRPRHGVEVRRDHIAEDGYDGLNGLGPALKGPVAITFRDQWGNIEAGIDGGGVFKEFLTSLTKEAFDVNRGLWLANAKQELYPNPHSYAREGRQLNWFRFMGRILGKALYDGILVDLAFAPFFLGKWLGKRSFFDDLASLDPELYNGLVYLKHCESPEDLSLNFTVTDAELGVTRTIDLMPNGSNITVTRENRLRYIALVASYRLNVQIRPQCDAFLEGLSDVVDLKWLRMFDQRELQILIGGVEEEINVEDLEVNTVYGGVYDEKDPTIQLFWKVVKSFSYQERRALLRFVTSCSRPPLLGFGELNPKFAMRDATSDQTRLPTSSTCVNLLKLPRYTNERILRDKLLTAINANAGFDLS